MLRVFIYPNLEKPHAWELTKNASRLLSGLGCGIIFTDSVPSELTDNAIISGSIKEAVTLCDIIVTIGGDGTILNIAELAAREKRKLLGINCGRLGFMASMEAEDLDKLGKLCTGEYTTESRMMLSASVTRRDGVVSSYTALNDIVITHGFNYNINDFTVMADDIKISSLRADGLIFSTPTGASAYSLSAGGPLIEPTLDCIEFTQICPHSLFARSMILSADKVLTVRFEADGEIGISSDGSDPDPLTKNDIISIGRSPYRLDLIDITGDNYFKSIGSKLMQPAK